MNKIDAQQPAIETGKNSFLTTEAPSIALPAPAVIGVEPEFIAMPSPGRECPYSGLKRGMLYVLEREGLIKTVSLRRKGSARGRRLIVLASLKAYLRGLNAEQNNG